MKVEHTIKATGDVLETLCGRVIAVNGAGAPCRACSRVRESRDTWSGKTVTVATDTTEESIALLKAIGEGVSAVGEEARFFAKVANVVADWKGKTVRLGDGRLMVIGEHRHDMVRLSIAEGPRAGESIWWADWDVWRALESGTLVEYVPPVAIGDTVYRDRDGAQGIVRDVLTSGDVDVAFVDGSGWIVNPSTLVERGFEIITAAELSEITSDAEHPVSTMRARSFRKIKNTRSARSRRGGK